ncbi:MAG: hypothetical protein CVU38_13050 [Chloroflexi bacterium HGW-Chloroflexi-1]|nr:MAG: hypothetical protein CVU38_13050 [Chloroflexi bacterium HGW-Chloroflexi-1]
MLRSLEGVYRNGIIELPRLPEGVQEETPVIITFLETRYVDLQTRGIDRIQAAVLRERLATFAEDWDHPEMDIYDKCPPSG